MASLHVASELVKAIGNVMYPVGSIYLTTNGTNPGTFLGGTWTKMTGGFLYGVVNGISNGNGTGTVTNSHTLTINQIPKHQHYIHGYLKANYPNYQVVTGQGGAELAASWDSGGTNQHHTNFVGKTQGHSHNIPYLGVWVWKRTA